MAVILLIINTILCTINALLAVDNLFNKRFALVLINLIGAAFGAFGVALLIT